MNALDLFFNNNNLLKKFKNRSTFANFIAKLAADFNVAKGYGTRD